jgi:hypothetical protein
MPEEQKSVLDAINEGLAELSGDTPTPPEPEAEAETPETAPEGETPPETEAEALEVEGEEKPEGEEPPEGEEKPEGEPEKKPETGPKAKKDEDLEEPLPKGTAIRTNERFQRLVGRIKESEAKVSELQTRADQGDELIKTITSAGMGAEEFGMSIQYAQLVKSPRLEDKEQAWNILVNELKALAPAIGRALPGEDPLSAHADLQKLVQEGKTTPELAREVAQHRARTGAAQKLTAEQQRAQEQQVQGQQAWESGKNALTALGNELRASDPDYARKEALIKPNLAAMLQAVPPAQWATVTRNLFAQLQLPPAAPKAPVVAARPNGPQPLRANLGAPGAPGAGPPKTVKDAINSIDFSNIR